MTSYKWGWRLRAAVSLVLRYNRLTLDRKMVEDVQS